MVQNNVPEHGVGPCTSLLLSEIMSPSEPSKKYLDQEKIMVKLQPQFINSFTPSLPQTTISTSLSLPSPTNSIPGSKI